MKAITLQQPQKIVFGTGCIKNFVEDYQKTGLRRLFVLTAPPIRPLIEETLDVLQAAGISMEVYQDITAEPTLNDFNSIVEQARRFRADSEYDATHLPAGLYIVSWQAGGHQRTAKFVKK